uniref:DENN domain containing 1A n=1 Tax=Ornithorhynchus anatinus TaxID=9258 RepID=A0A6I8NZ25_ORNAN
SPSSPRAPGSGVGGGGRECARPCGGDAPRRPWRFPGRNEGPEPEGAGLEPEPEPDRGRGSEAGAAAPCGVPGTMGSRIKQNPETTFEVYAEVTYPGTSGILSDPEVLRQFPEDYSDQPCR